MHFWRKFELLGGQLRLFQKSALLSSDIHLYCTKHFYMNQEVRTFVQKLPAPPPKQKNKQKKPMKQQCFGTVFVLFWANSVLLLLDGLCSTQPASTTGSNETDLATGGCVPPDGGGLANMLMVTTAEGMLNRLCVWKRKMNAGTKRSITAVAGAKTLTFMATPRTRGQQFLLALYLW